ncbi:hypothetical protein K461DRAFT_266055 [Myriangium duriaei CBS 260.36]|uniref:Uncharacterized protein n=1 Tax=Myriangium duriaei CBS 260.36 TaxID=1168546 RepID=A0A9P4MHE3_9PEZI|nr:hypothetical protein K461DRAFT_266055 [Myriangium duriaei CBS 260.36]
MASSSPNPDQDHQTVQDHVAEISRIANEINQGSTAWPQYLETATAAIQAFMLFPSFDMILAPQQKVDILNCLQQIAHQNQGSESSSEIADWCSSEWLRLLEHDSEHVDALYGLALYWLYRSQSVLHRIYESDRLSFSSSSSLETHTHGRKSLESSHSLRLDDIEDDMENRLSSDEFIEARTSLQPAAEYFDRAITAAGQQNLVNDEMLSRAAEAYISLGNTSSPRVNQRYYRRAIHLLRRALELGYTLGSSLQQ